jgi:anaerobic magnesium-protoporphyrin IX monomethyl ester cyclase
MTLKILFMFPNTSNEGVAPLGVASLSTIARQEQCEVRYFETSFYRMGSSAYDDRKTSGEFKRFEKEVFDIQPRDKLEPDFIDLLDSYKPDILAVHANSLEWELFLEIMGKIRLKSRPFVIVGGCHATVDAEGAIESDYVDAICVGEGEKPWRELLKAFKKSIDISKIGGLWVKTKNGINRNPIANLMSAEELWEQPLDFSHFDERHFRYVFDGEVYNRGSLELSRGCPYDCTYCVNTGFKEIYKGKGQFMRVRPYDSLLKAAKYLSQRVDMIQFQDESFFSVPSRTIEEFAEWYGSEVGLPFMVQVRPETVNRKKIEYLAKIGVPVQMSVGIESGSSRVLKDICNRKTRVKALHEAFAIIKDYGVRTTGYTMIGFPTETRDEVFQTIELVRSIDLDISIMSVFFPFKGTPLRDLCIEKGYISGDEPARSFTEGPILKNQPLSPKDIMGIRRTYALYTKLPKDHFGDIERCEKDYENNAELYRELVELVNKEYYKTWEINPRSLPGVTIDAGGTGLLEKAVKLPPPPPPSY